MRHIFKVLINHHENGEKRNMFKFNTEKRNLKIVYLFRFGKKNIRQKKVELSNTVQKAMEQCQQI